MLSLIMATLVLRAATATEPCDRNLTTVSWESTVDQDRIKTFLRREFADSPAYHVTAFAVPPIDTPHVLNVAAALTGGVGAQGLAPTDLTVVVLETADEPILWVFAFPADGTTARRVSTALYPVDGEDSLELQALIPGAFEHDDYDYERVVDVLTGFDTLIVIK